MKHLRVLLTVSLVMSSLVLATGQVTFQQDRWKPSGKRHDDNLMDVSNLGNVRLLQLDIVRRLRTVCAALHEYQPRFEADQKTFFK
ncbi:hypothetical protein HDE_11640 [Halotydeus destructor]|nr:hypothetical protein HDE_11640 [Halotydeus destructor]